MFLFVVISFFLVLADVVSKKLAVVYLALGKEIFIIPKLLSLYYVENKGAAFGIMTNAQWFLILIGIAVCICILYYVNAELCKSRWQYAALIFIFSGAAGNLIDRALLGYVVDFINLPRWPAFNFADVFINAGVILYLIYIFTHKNS